jgi:hypothetical protein
MHLIVHLIITNHRKCFNAINVEGTFFWLLHQDFRLQSTQNLGVSVVIGKEKGGQVDEISVVTFVIKIFGHNQPQNPSCKIVTMEKKGAQIDQILVTISPKPWSQWSD